MMISFGWWFLTNYSDLPKKQGGARLEPFFKDGSDLRLQVRTQKYDDVRTLDPQNFSQP